MSKRRPIYEFAKRALDLLASAFLLVLLSPVYLVIAVIVATRLGRPVIFRQQRPGRYERPFTLYKFRSMKAASSSVDAVAAVGTDAQRLTRFGSMLRSTSLDELPEFFNVLRGDMSLVGPRPLLMEYLDRYNSEQARRHEVRPGVTGWAQVNGRNAVSWPERFEMDVWYVDHRTFWLDLRILFMTVASVFRRSDISSGTHVTMEPFDPEKHAVDETDRRRD